MEKCAVGKTEHVTGLMREYLAAPPQHERFGVPALLERFAIDLDAPAIAFARRGLYPAAALAGLPPELVDRYFNPVGSAYEVKKRVRSLIMFG